MKTRRPAGSGSISYRKSDGRWIGQLDAGWTSHATRRRLTVYGHTREEVERKLEELKAQPTPPLRREGSRNCDRCGVRTPSADIIFGFCGGCFPWGLKTPGGFMRPQRPKDWTTYDCTVCGVTRWTHSGTTICVGCRRTEAWSRRFERVSAAKALGTFTPQEWQGLLEAHGFACLYCGRTDVPLTRDHVVPVARGGSELIENLAPACKRCNASKNDRTLREYAEAIR